MRVTRKPEYAQCIFCQREELTCKQDDHDFTPGPLDDRSGLIYLVAHVNEVDQLFSLYPTLMDDVTHVVDPYDVRRCQGARPNRVYVGGTADRFSPAVHALHQGLIGGAYYNDQDLAPIFLNDQLRERRQWFFSKQREYGYGVYG